MDTFLAMMIYTQSFDDASSNFPVSRKISAVIFFILVLCDGWQDWGTGYIYRYKIYIDKGVALVSNRVQDVYHQL